MAERETVVALVEEVRADLADLGRVHGGAPSLARALDRICTRIQRNGDLRALPGADKRELAIEAAMLALERFLPPTWYQYLPVPLVRWLLGRAIDQVVALFKAKGWPEA